MKTEKKYILTEDDIFALLKEAYRHGFSTSDMVEAGLERYDADGYAGWAIKSLKPKQLLTV